MKQLSILMMLSLMVFFVACKDEEEDPPEPTCDTESMTYITDIKPIYETNCTVPGCHSTNTTNTFPMDTYDLAVAAVGFGCIEKVIQHTDADATSGDPETCLPMPIGGDKLDDCSINKILAWIAADMPE